MSACTCISTVVPCSVQVRGVVEESRTEPLATFDVDDDVTTLKYLDSRMYVALQNGQLVVVARDAGENALRVCLLDILVLFLRLSPRRWSVALRSAADDRGRQRANHVAARRRLRHVGCVRQARARRFTHSYVRRRARRPPPP